MAEVSATEYGKNVVRLMRVRREGSLYSVTELRVDVKLQLSSVKDYERGDNSDVVATDSTKNTVHVLAKRNPIESPEQFGLLLCKHFLTTYRQVVSCKVYIEQAPWQRIKQGGMEHAHAFILEPSALRFCTVSQLKGGAPVVCGGLKDMTIFKATQSGFEGFVRDQFTTLPETSDRAFCTKVYAKYEFDGDTYGVDFNGTWTIAQSAILDTFAGPPYTGTYSPSVQNTMFETAKVVFSRVPNVKSIEIHMPNIHYFTADLSKLGVPNSGELLLPSNEPQGMITATFSRPQAKL